MACALCKDPVVESDPYMLHLGAKLLKFGLEVVTEADVEVVVVVS